MSNNSEKNKETIDNFLGSIKDFRPEFKSLNYEKDDIENYLMNYQMIHVKKQILIIQACTKKCKIVPNSQI